MSASLVGSEMCIRDRHFWGSARSCLKRAERACSVLQALEASFFVRPTTDCLLYTSDAADDM
eukprot:426680-Alexandrium_andersonii.AAC.1